MRALAASDIFSPIPIEIENPVSFWYLFFKSSNSSMLDRGTLKMASSLPLLITDPPLYSAHFEKIFTPLLILPEIADSSSASSDITAPPILCPTSSASIAT